jgi:hypothetical protein
MQDQLCLFCGNTVQLVHVHGHYQCPVCKTNALPCCDGDNCETNYTFLLSEQTSFTDPLKKSISAETKKPPLRGSLEGL